MIKNAAFVIALFIMFISDIQAQKKGDWRLQIPVNTFLSSNPNAAAGFLYQYDSSKQLGLEIGYIYSTRSPLSLSDENVSKNVGGLNVSLSNRWIFNSALESASNSLYFELSLDYSFISFSATRAGGVGCNDIGWDCTYIREVESSIRQQIPGASWKIGIINYLGDRLSVDLNAGIGIYHRGFTEIDNGQINDPFNYYFDNLRLSSNTENNLIGGINIGVLIGILL